MKRHIRRRHPYVYDQEIKELVGTRVETVDTPASETKQCSEDEKQNSTNKSIEGSDEESAQKKADSELEVDSGTVLNEAHPDFEEKVKNLCAKPVAGKSKYETSFSYHIIVYENMCIVSTSNFVRFIVFTNSF